MMGSFIKFIYNIVIFHWISRSIDVLLGFSPFTVLFSEISMLPRNVAVLPSFM